MAINLASLRRGGENRPPTILLYGPEGVGKTSLAAGAPHPVLLPIEDGIGMLDIPTFPILKTFQDVEEAIGTLATEDHDFKTGIIDSVDWLQPLVWAETCRLHGWKNIEEPGFGKGYAAALDTWKYLLDGFAALRNERGMCVILIAHSAVVKFESPETEAYDRFVPKLQESKKGDGANPLLKEFVDCIFFNNFRTSIVKDRAKGEKVGEGRARGVGGGNRVIYTQDRPAAVAKNRYGMPPEIFLPDNPALSWPEVAQHIPYFNAPVALAA